MLFSTAMANPQPSRESEARARLRQLQDEMRRLNTELARREGRQGELRLELEAVERRIGDLTHEARTLSGRIQQLESRSEELRTQEVHLHELLSRQQDMLARQLRSRYLAGRQERLKLLLNLESPENAERQMIYYGYLDRYRLGQIDAVNRTLAELSDVREALQHNSAQLLQAQRELEDERLALERKFAQRGDTLALLEKQMSRDKDTLSRLNQERSALQTLLKRLQNALADIPEHPPGDRPFRTLKGSLSWPAAGRIENRFGKRARGGAERLTWQGALIRARRNDAVYAIARGRVAFADWIRGYGLLIILDHGDGYMSLYGHNQSLYRSAGEWVEQGEQIATVGLSGGQEEPALYFEIRRNGKPVNPARWCAKRRRISQASK